MSDEGRIDLRRTAVVTVDLTNDFLHPDGAYGRGGQGTQALAALPERVKPVIDAVRARGGIFISVQFTLVPRPGDGHLIAPHLAALRPFLKPGNFAPGSWGNKAVDILQVPDVEIEKIAYSGFYQTRMDHVLTSLGIDTLVMAGIVTNGGVASTVRDAHMRGHRVLLLSDGCGAFRRDIHEATLVSLGSIVDAMTCAEFLARTEVAR